MKIMMVLEVADPDFDDVPKEERADEKMRFEDDLLEGLTSTDMQVAMEEVLENYYIYSYTSELELGLNDCRIVQPAVRNQRPRFMLRTWGGLVQTNEKPNPRT